MSQRIRFARKCVFENFYETNKIRSKYGIFAHKTTKKIVGMAQM